MFPPSSFLAQALSCDSRRAAQDHRGPRDRERAHEGVQDNRVNAVGYSQSSRAPPRRRGPRCASVGPDHCRQSGSPERRLAALATESRRQANFAGCRPASGLDAGNCCRSPPPRRGRGRTCGRAEHRNGLPCRVGGRLRRELYLSGQQPRVLGRLVRSRALPVLHQREQHRNREFDHQRGGLQLRSEGTGRRHLAHRNRRRLRHPHADTDPHGDSDSDAHPNSDAHRDPDSKVDSYDDRGQRMRRGVGRRVRGEL